MKNKKGFTLIELLAVIVILGLLMAIAIPSVTKYITESRKKTVVSTIGNYIGALVNDVNDLTYTFTDTNTVYAVPIECIALERGGTNPFGYWLHANDSYWAYVLVQYDDETSSYRYGYTFKDSAGYGLYPTTQSKLNESGKQIQTGLDLKTPEEGKVTSITDTNNWNGFAIDSSTELVVLEATSEGEVGDGKTTCTLQQKGDNYDQVEEIKKNSPQQLKKLIKKHNAIITAAPTLAYSSSNFSDVSGLYMSTATNSGKATYYFRGDVKNNYVTFAGQTWRIIRINEDGTIRLIVESRINNAGYEFNGTYSMYYSNSSKARNNVENWYTKTIKNKGYDSYVENGEFCEQAKVLGNNRVANGNQMVKASEYIPSFRCEKDAKGFGIINLKAGLITIDELLFSGHYFNFQNTACYLVNGAYGFWTMSPAGYQSNGYADEWRATSVGKIEQFAVIYSTALRPVINLKSNVKALGTGTSSDPYVIQTN